MGIHQFAVSSALVSLGLVLVSCKGEEAPAPDAKTDAKAAANPANAAAPKSALAKPSEPQPPPCGDLLTAAAVKKACGLNVTFGDVPLQGKTGAYRCEVKGFVDGTKKHWVSFRVMDLGEPTDRPPSYGEAPGLSRYAGGQKGRYRYTVTEALFNAPKDRTHGCDEAALRTLAADVAARLP